MKQSPPRLSVLVIVPDVEDRARSTTYSRRKRLRRGDSVIGWLRATFNGLLAEVQRDYPT